MDDDNNDEAGDDDAEPKKVEVKKKKKDTDVLQLKRPIIFICNDMYARALAPLREIALSVKIEESNPKKLLERIRYICKQEKVSIDDQVIRELAEETNYDARSCLNTLQFISSAQKSTAKRITVASAVENGKFACFKDNFDNVFNVTDTIMFNKVTNNQFNNVKALNEVKGKVLSFGDPDLLNDFVYHNYSQSVSYFDDDLEKTALYLDFLSKNDNVNHFIRRSQNYEMYSS